jgi:hypothetical protein
MNDIAFYSDAMGSGKSTAASYLIETHGYELVKFAGPLKDMTRALFKSLGYDDVTVERMVEGDYKEVNDMLIDGLTPRKVMQTLGTEWGQHCLSQDFWVRIAGARIDNSGPVVVDDLRFPHEWEFLKGRGFTIVKLERSGAAVVGGGHSSEQGLVGFEPDCVVKNNGNFEDLHNQLEKLL